MPIPIHLVNDVSKSENSSNLDYSFLFTTQPTNKKMVLAGDRDAGLLFDLWNKGIRKQDSIRFTPEMNVAQKDIIRLKTMGLVTGDTNEINVTRKGRTVITTMALGEVNNFEKNRKVKTYTEILASMDKRNKSGYRIPKTASKEVNSTCNNWYKKAKMELEAHLIDKEPDPKKSLHSICSYCGRWATNPTSSNVAATEYTWKKTEELDSEEKKTLK